MRVTPPPAENTHPWRTAALITLLLIICTTVGAALIDACFGGPPPIATPIPHLAFDRNATQYTLTYTPAGNEALVGLAPMVRSGGFGEEEWIARSGVARAGPTEPVVLAGPLDAVPERFEIRVERDNAVTVDYFNVPRSKP